MTLDVVEAGLNDANIQTIRFDGKVPQRERQGVIDRFRSDPSIRVMLLTLSCGAVGYVALPSRIGSDVSLLTRMFLD